MGKNDYKIIGNSSNSCTIIPIYDDGDGRLEDRSLYTNFSNNSVSVGRAICYDISIIGAQIIKKIDEDVVSYECYLGSPCEFDKYGTPTEVRIGRFKYKAGDFSSYFTPRVTKRKLMVFSERDELASTCFKALNPEYGLDDYGFCGIEHSSAGQKFTR